MGTSKYPFRKRINQNSEEIKFPSSNPNEGTKFPSSNPLSFIIKNYLLVVSYSCVVVLI
jgi:hypothetical protein